MDTHETLVHGRNYIVRHGWRQGWGAYHKGDPACAVVGCHLSVGKETEGLLGALAALATVIGLPSGANVVEWNDAPGRTEQEVLAAFDKAIAATAPEPDMENVTDAAPLLERVA